MGWSVAVVFHGEDERSGVPGAADFNPADLGYIAKTVQDGVFDKRLQQKTWHQSCFRFGIDIDMNQQPLAKTDTFDIDISVRQCNFRAKADLVLEVAAEG